MRDGVDPVPHPAALWNEWTVRTLADQADRKSKSCVWRSLFSLTSVGLVR